MPSVTQAVEDYLKAIWRLSHEGGERVSVGDIATELNVSAPSVTSMVRKLKTMRLLNYERYGGVTLTPRGRKIALEIVRHHRLWELYLYMRLGVPLERVDGEAERLEHVLSDDMEELLTRNLGDPTHDPHGDPIPTKTGALAPVEGIALGQLEKGTHAIVARVSDRNPEKLRYLVSLGLLPGARIEVAERAPFRGPLTVVVGNRRHVVGADLANLVIVRRRKRR
ncbi:MAG: metal-dependent transcriptional regulator [Candidatus Eisenbacteria bacterium]|uniref:Manganese transport regulator n=1 Tax=Eiseniibacteriota bacterium TaxID=2212470 RepID=A0A538T6A9_UNCEI|nr:MAG: metal-dependent transcriptional regulator [Candidatus Eisenbacteria bacterium]